MWNRICFIVSTIILTSHASFGMEFTFDLADRLEECFYEVIKENMKVYLDYQVIEGGQRDIDVLVQGPSHKILYRGERREYDTVRFNTTEAGEHKICFNNQFSTFTHKTVYMSFHAGEDNPLLETINNHYQAMTFMEATASEIHDSLDDVVDGQTSYRLKEALGRRYAEDLNERVLWWSLAQALVILTIGISQVLILRNFFSEPKLKNRPTVPLRQPRYGYTS